MSRAATPPGTTDSRILSASAVMAAGTTVSRLSGYVRSALLVAALGTSLHADVFTIANTVPNMLYILLAGGVFNAVLVPQLVRSMKEDPDGGEAYTNRVITLAALFLGVVTVVLVLAAPFVMSVLLDSSWSDPALAEQRDSAIDFARYCLPQVFFYGMFVLVGQVLNARGRFGPMMWAPIANNVIAVGVLLVYLLAFGPAEGVERSGPFTGGRELLLGLGSTVGIVAQLLILLPYLRRAGFTYRPRFDFRGTGLGHTLRLGTWTVLFVIVNQVAYTVVVRLASGGPAESTDGTGYTIYSSSFLLVMVPHAILTVSLATAILPRLSAHARDHEYADVAGVLASTLRTALAVVLPFAALLPVVAPELATVVFGYGAGAADVESFVPTLSLLGIGLVVFTVHYLMLRGFYSLEQTRTVFLIQCAVSAVNVLAAVVLVRATSPADTAPALTLAYAAAYVVGAALSYGVLRGRLGGLHTPTLVRFLVRMVLAVTASTGAALAVAVLLPGWGEEPSRLLALARGAAIGLVDLGVLLLAARVLRLREITSVVDTVRGRLSRT
ncbi:murein biosynthesis integral membrane protein MurJ [uncultured Nocardioides sp.]|uniref:Proposed peptidoglycan lipid II flippase MurJ n=1 Tax=uncultured Nocardioides sp. TaxID=198441 RepID=A0A6J4MYF2_9ACTN|nr:murein biosynthesis integral membrane protein MurJ [uncultured Nocardioides sp.]CAA9372397.1 MAG: Proposed peptidoglycan lipid II flippase MurJ [uncultured Nocardioides sp.]